MLVLVCMCFRIQERFRLRFIGTHQQKRAVQTAMYRQEHMTEGASNCAWVQKSHLVSFLKHRINCLIRKVCEYCVHKLQTAVSL